MKKQITQTTFLTVTFATLLGSAISLNINAADYDSSADHNHGGLVSDENIKMRAEMKSNHGMQPQMKMMKDRMQAEMQTIINTEDSAKRKALFANHKKKMHSMMQNMRKNCNQTNKSSTSIGHQGEED